MKGGKPINPDKCKGLPYLVKGLEYDVKTEAYIKGEAQTDYKAFFDGNCKPPYVVSTMHMSHSLKGSYLLVKNPEPLGILIQKWIKLIEPLSKELFASSAVGLRSNINPFKTYYDQLQLYNSLLVNKKGMLSKMVTSDSEAFFTEDNIRETLQGIKMKYDYFSGLPFDMKEFLGFEKIGSGWMSTEAGRKQKMLEIDEEVESLAKPTSSTEMDMTKAIADE